MCWRCREQERLATRHYEKVPGTWPSIDEHHIHVAFKKPKMVAFTESAEKGRRDIQTPMKPGKYLKKYFALSDDSIKLCVEQFTLEGQPPELFIAVEPKDIANVYQKGPNSCMSHPVNSFDDCQLHPTEVYGASDLGIAYIKNDKGNISARALVVPKKKAHARIYGDEVRLGATLKAKGYKRDDEAFEGCKLLYLPSKVYKNIHMPYIDVLNGKLNIENEQVSLASEGAYQAHTQCGTLLIRITVQCPECQGSFLDDATYSDMGNVHWCDSCASRRRFCSKCESTQLAIHLHSETGYCLACQTASA